MRNGWIYFWIWSRISFLGIEWPPICKETILLQRDNLTAKRQSCAVCSTTRDLTRGSDALDGPSLDPFYHGNCAMRFRPIAAQQCRSLRLKAQTPMHEPS